MFVGPVPEEKLPKDATPGRVLTGRLTIAKLPKAAGGGDAPGAVRFSYTCGRPLPLTVPLRGLHGQQARSGQRYSDLLIGCISIAFRIADRDWIRLAH